MGVGRGREGAVRGFKWDRIEEIYYECK